MITRWVRHIGVALVTWVVLCSPAYAQRKPVKAPPPPQAAKPVVQYILVFVLLALPIGLICRSSRR